MSAAANFDRLATFYRALEFVAFGRDLERTRFALLDRLAGCRRILVLGEGDGRCLARLVRLAPGAAITCVDGSAAMLAAAARRLGAEDRPRVNFLHRDILTFTPPPEDSYDAVLTLFFLDCFTTAEVGAIVGRVAPRVTHDAVWLFADFAMPLQGWRRLRARIWLGVLYAFFGWQTGLRTRALPDSEREIERAGFAVETVREFQHGMLRAVFFRRA